MKKFLFLLTFCFIFSNLIFAGEPLIWSVNSPEAISKGNAKGVSINANGSITIAQKLNTLFFNRATDNLVKCP